MKRLLYRLVVLAQSKTAKDTYVLFSGNIFSAFLGFLFVLFVARLLSVSDFGIFSATTNLVTVLSSLADFGISAGIINFVSSAISKNNMGLANSYTKSAFIFRSAIVFIIFMILFAFAPVISRSFLATSDKNVSVLASLLIIAFFFWTFFPVVLQAKKNFIGSVVVDISFMTARLIALALFWFLGVNLYNALGTYVFGGLISALVGFMLVGFKFLKSKPSKTIKLKLLRFSGWMGVNKVISSVSGGLDIQMLAIFLGATATGYYSISYRLATFISVLVGSFSSVLATRLAGFGNKTNEKKYIFKSFMVSLLISLGVVVWVIVAKPFILLLFGIKYFNSIQIFQALALALIPFVLAAPFTTAIIYALKKPRIIGLFSVYQIITILVLNYFLIPRLGVFGPIVSIAVVNITLLVLTVSVFWKNYIITHEV